jgi:threonylcarbamoyladenosine tRNA methylthiotransferase MtaB
MAYPSGISQFIPTLRKPDRGDHPTTGGGALVRYHRNVPGYYVENFGCRATQADGAALEQQFEERGYSRAEAASDAAVVVLNTCTVTAAADQDARAAIRRLRRQNPEARIVVTGCYAQRAPDEIAALEGVDLVVGNSHKHELAEILRSRFRPRTSDLRLWTSGPGPQTSDATFIPLSALGASSAANREGGASIYVSDIFAHTELLAAPVFDAANERTRPNLKIQDGCDNRCSFCVIPYVRGQSRSLGMGRVLNEVQALVEAGYREVVISGINLGRWGRDLNNFRTDSLRDPDARSRAPRFEDLLRAILEQTSLEKLRISSVEPMDWSDELIDLMARSPRIAKHAHVPMQSGSDAVLRRMHRKYRPRHYREKTEKIRAAMPTAAIGADVMVGFPGESEEEFEATRRMVEDLPFTYLHVFTYSPRPGTPAAAMAGQVPGQVARERNRILREMAAAKKLAFMRGFVGSEIEAITLKQEAAYEGARATQFAEALTDNYLKLRVRGRHEANRWMRARVEDVMDGALVGNSHATNAA